MYLFTISLKGGFMTKRYAIITDIHGNIEALNAILNDIESQNIDEIYCLGDTVGIGPNSKECVDKLIEKKIKSTLGNHELYAVRGTRIDPSIEGEEKDDPDRSDLCSSGSCHCAGCHTGERRESAGHSCHDAGHNAGNRDYT